MLGHLASLIKPRIVALLCVTGVAAALAAGGGPPTVLIAFLLAGATIAAGSAALNCYYDRDLDRHMSRTADRPLPSGDLSPRVALTFTIGLLAVGTTVGLATLPPISVAFMWLGVLAYAGLYTAGLKRRHPIGVVLGGSAGSFPVLAGWTAVAPPETIVSLGAGAAPWLMAALVFVWTPAHAWALAYVYREDFAAAGVPTLPAVAGVERVSTAVWRWALGTVAVAALVVPITGVVYAAALIVATPFLLGAYWRFYRARTERAAVRAFFASNTFLAAIFAGWAASGLLDPSPFAVLAVAGLTLGLFAWVGRASPALDGVPADVDPLLAWVTGDDLPETDPAATPSHGPPSFVEDSETQPVRPDGGSTETEPATGDDGGLGSPIATVPEWVASAWQTLRSVYYANSVSWRVFKTGGLVFLGFFCWAGANVVLSYRPGWTPLYLLLSYGFLLVIYGPIHHLVVIPLSFRLRRRPDRLSRVGRRLPTAMLVGFFVAVGLLALNPVGPMLIDFTAALSTATGGDVDPALLCTTGTDDATAAVHCHLDSSEGISRVVVESGGQEVLVDDAPPFDFILQETELRETMDQKRFTVKLEGKNGDLLRQYTRSLSMIDDGQIGN